MLLIFMWVGRLPMFRKHVANTNVMLAINNQHTIYIYSYILQ